MKSNIGTKGNDRYFDVEGDSQVRMGRGNDIVYDYKGSGNDLYFMGTGDDFVFLNKGDDTVFGDAGDDTVVAKSRGDIVFDGGRGHDVLELMELAKNATVQLKVDGDEIDLNVISVDKHGHRQLQHIELTDVETIHLHYKGEDVSFPM